MSNELFQQMVGDREVMQQALDALIEVTDQFCPGFYDNQITALREALAAPQTAAHWTPSWATYRQGVEDGKAEALESAQPAQEPVTTLFGSLPVYDTSVSTQPGQETVAVFELQKTGWEIVCDLDWIQTLPFGTKLYTTTSHRLIPTNTWVPVTQELLNEHPDWLYQPMWIAKGRGVVQGYYEWRQGHTPDRFITDYGDEWVFDFDFVMPIEKPEPPVIEEQS